MDPLHVLAVAGRVTLIYAVLLVLLRVAGRRELAQATPMDLLTLLLLSETVSGALTGESPLVPGLIAAATLIALSMLVTWLTFRFRRLERVFEGAARVLIVDGKVHEDVLRDEKITNLQLESALHAQGLRAVSEVERAFVEPSGEISIIPRGRSS